MDTSLNPVEEREALIKVLLLLLAPPDSAEVEWLNTAEETLSSNPDSLTISRTYEVPVASRLAVLLRESMLAHRWKDAVRLLISIIKRPSMKDGHLVINVLLELFHELSEYIEVIRLNSLCSNLKVYAELTEKEVCVQFFLYHAIHDRFKEACCSMELNKPKRRAEVSFAQNSRECDLLYKAYNGLKWWTMIKNEATPNSERLSKVEINNIMRLAIEEFAAVLKEPGVWDIFLTKYVELLEELNETTFAQSVLVRYAEMNGSNPNAWKYLYYFYKRHEDDTLALEALQELVTLVPSDELVLELYKFSKEGKILRADTLGYDRISLLFDLLDHVNWCEVAKPWKLLAKELVTSFCSESKKVVCRCHNSLQACWTLRSDWWPSYHFRESKSSDIGQRTDRVQVYKAIVARFLLGDGNKYTRSVLKTGTSKPRKCYDLLETAMNMSCLELTPNTF